MSRLSAFYDRDYANWAHPELAAIYEESLKYTQYEDIIINPDMPMEERKAAAADYMMPPLEVTPEIADRYFVYEIPGSLTDPDAPKITVRVAKPKKVKRKMACVVNMAAGGLVACGEVPSVIEMSDLYNCVSATWNYTTILDGGCYPKTIDECEAAYMFLVEHADELNINPKKIVLYGMSAGGHLSLALAHRLRSRGITPRGVVAIVPCIDDRLIYNSSHIKQTGWGRNQAFQMTTQWLGNNNPATLPPDAFPNHATIEECIGLPPTFIHCFANDIYADPCAEYASKLNAAGVFVSLHMWPGTSHDALYSGYTMFRDQPDEYPFVYAFQKTLENDVNDCIKYDLTRRWAVDAALEGEAAEREELEALK